jgi:rod shape-determining protein MreD
VSSSYRAELRSLTKQQTPPYLGPPWYAAAAWLFAAVVAQATVVHYLAVRGVVPSLVLVAVVWYAMRADTRRAAFFGLAAGLCEDVLAAQTGAAWTISTTLIAVLTNLLTSGFFADSIPLVCVVTVLASLLRALFFWTVMALEGYPSGLAGLHLHQAVLQALLNTVLAVAATLIARRGDARAR